MVVVTWSYPEVGSLGDGDFPDGILIIQNAINKVYKALESGSRYSDHTNLAFLWSRQLQCSREI